MPRKTKNGTGAHFVRDALGMFLVLAFIAAMGALLWKAIPSENEQLLAYMLGQLSGFVAGVVGYHYISKSGEKELEEQRAVNTGAAFDAIREAARATPGDGDGATRAAHETADAAVDRAEEIEQEHKP